MSIITALILMDFKTVINVSTECYNPPNTYFLLFTIYMHLATALCFFNVITSEANFENKIMELNSINRESRSCSNIVFGPHFMKEGVHNYFILAIFILLGLLSFLILLGG